jgi:hypothetical protein
MAFVVFVTSYTEIKHGCGVENMAHILITLAEADVLSSFAERHVTRWKE